VVSSQTSALFPARMFFRRIPTSGVNIVFFFFFFRYLRTPHSATSLNAKKRRMGPTLPVCSLHRGSASCLSFACGRIALRVNTGQRCATFCGIGCLMFTASLCLPDAIAGTAACLLLPTHGDGVRLRCYCVSPLYVTGRRCLRGAEEGGKHADRATSAADAERTDARKGRQGDACSFAGWLGLAAAMLVSDANGASGASGGGQHARTAANERGGRCGELRGTLAGLRPSCYSYLRYICLLPYVDYLRL